MKVLAIIPARMGSSRFPGKPMKNILGVPMIEMIYKKVIECKLVEKTIVATCDDVIFNHLSELSNGKITYSSDYKQLSDSQNLIKLTNKKFGKTPVHKNNKKHYRNFKKRNNN